MNIVMIAFGALAATAALAQPLPPFGGCGGINPTKPTITPTFQVSNGEFTNLGFECQMWQNFIYINWPALPGQRGMPNTKAKFSAPGPTVWESYKTVEQVFLPGAANPGPWDTIKPPSTLTASLSARVSSGSVRLLKMDSKVSRPVLANVARRAASMDPTILNSITQAAGGTLYDLNGNPVYYEVAMNRDEYEYIVQNGLYNANTQATYAQTTDIVLPSGQSKYGQYGALEVKAAWKILTPAQIKSGRFHTVQALIPGTSALAPVTVGLVGFHMYLPNVGQGVWATFAQIDNAPLRSEMFKSKGPFNFYKPPCWPPTCAIVVPYNVENANPGQVVQIQPDDPSAAQLNPYMQALIRQYDQKSPWQYYKIVNVQWSETTTDISKIPPPSLQPLPYGKPPNDTVLNAVLETFIQQPGNSCLACHRTATIVSSAQNAPATAYSFVFSAAQTPPTGQ
jgi:hypothetical protein